MNGSSYAYQMPIKVNKLICWKEMPRAEAEALRRIAIANADADAVVDVARVDPK